MIPKKVQGNGIDDMDAAMMASQKLTEEEVVHDMLVQWEGRENLRRLTAFKALVGERNYQDGLNCARLSIGEELVLLSTYLRKAEDNFTTTFEYIQDRRTMDIVRKITAIGLRCMENHGSVERKK